MDLSIIILNYQSGKKAIKCIEAIYASDLADISFEIILVDNNSGDRTTSAIKEKFGNIILIESKTNLGMGKGNNLGIKNATGRCILILNPDAYVEPGSIKTLLDFMDENPDTGIVGPKIIYPDGQLQETCYRFPRIHTFISRRTLLKKYPRLSKHLDWFLMRDFDHQSVQKVDWLMGCCFIARKELLEKSGGFDERFFMYLEDTDLCRQAWSLGYSVIYNPNATAVHDHARASAEMHWLKAIFSKKIAWIHLSSWLKYFMKWGTAPKNYGI
jgi:N-acetylglucosaminyl-diphospho-decaprenol L-rhamnosyltransferase